MVHLEKLKIIKMTEYNNVFIIVARQILARYFVVADFFVLLYAVSVKISC